MRATFSTTSVPTRDRLAYWREAVCDVFIHLDVDLRDAPHEDFSGTIVQHTTGALDFSEVIATGHRAIRSPRQVSRGGEDCFIVMVQRSGCSRIEQDGRSATLWPG